MSTGSSCTKLSWFRPKPWVSDSGISRIISSFRICNSGLGNRGPAKNGMFYKLCPLCSKIGIMALNNEVTLLSIKIVALHFHDFRFICFLIVLRWTSIGMHVDWGLLLEFIVKSSPGFPQQSCSPCFLVTRIPCYWRNELWIYIQWN